MREDHRRRADAQRIAHLGNWDWDAVPGSGNNVIVVGGASVTDGQSEFATLAVQSGATVTFSEGFQAGTITSAGTVDYPGVWRLGGGTVTLTGTGSFGSDITHLDLRGADLNFHDGASSGARFNFEHRFTDTFGFTLSETGFTALELGVLWGGDKGGGIPTVWSDATYNIDVSLYDPTKGRIVWRHR